jgi:hypothetical protein
VFVKLHCVCTCFLGIWAVLRKLWICSWPLESQFVFPRSLGIHEEQRSENMRVSLKTINCFRDVLVLLCNDHPVIWEFSLDLFLFLRNCSGVVGFHFFLRMGRCFRLVNCFYIGTNATFKSTVTCRPEIIVLLSNYTVLYGNDSDFSVKTVTVLLLFKIFNSKCNVNWITFSVVLQYNYVELCNNKFFWFWRMLAWECILEDTSKAEEGWFSWWRRLGKIGTGCLCNHFPLSCCK